VKLPDRKPALCLAGGAFFFAILIYSAWIEPYWVTVKHIDCRQPNLKRILEGKTAVHLTDLHIESIGRREHLILQIIDEVKPEFIFLTGDYVRWNGDYEPALDFLSRLTAKGGVWAVMGDYDYSNDRKSCLFCHEKESGRPTKRHGVRFLRNSHEKTEVNGELLYIVGLEMAPVRSRGSMPNRPEWPALPRGNAAVVLVHNPLAFDDMAAESNALVLAGDTHGGQVPLFGWVWQRLGYKKNTKYEYGVFSENGKTMFVSSGVGTSHVPFRLFCRPEVVVLHF
jgi:hypothetical protein